MRIGDTVSIITNDRFNGMSGKVDDIHVDPRAGELVWVDIEEEDLSPYPFRRGDLQ